MARGRKTLTVGYVSEPAAQPGKSTLGEFPGSSGLTSVAISAAETLQGLLEAHPEQAARLQHDLHAILNGWETLGDFTELERARVRIVLGFMSPDELTELIGPPPER